MRPAPLIIAALAIFAAWKLYSSRDIQPPPGMIAAADPVQEPLEGATGIERGVYVLRPRAVFNARVRILAREDYSRGDLAALVPTDFAVGWGPMSDSAVLADVRITQANRFYFWRTEHWPVSRQQIEQHSANWHVIPGSETVRRTLGRARPGNVVELHGQLVDIEGTDGGMKTSLTRGDTGAGACEILLAETARILEAGR